METTIDWLAARNGHELLKRSVVVLNDAYRCANKTFITHVTETLGKRVHSVKTVPWDAHLRDAATLDFPALNRRPSWRSSSWPLNLPAGSRQRGRWGVTIERQREGALRRQRRRRYPSGCWWR